MPPPSISRCVCQPPVNLPRACGAKDTSPSEAKSYGLLASILICFNGPNPPAAPSCRRPGVGLQHERDHVGVLLARELPGAVERHGQCGCARTDRPRSGRSSSSERAAKERRRHVAAFESGAMAAGALLQVRRLAAPGLRGGVDAVPHGAGRPTAQGRRRTTPGHHARQPDAHAPIDRSARATYREPRRVRLSLSGRRRRCIRPSSCRR